MTNFGPRNRNHVVNADINKMYTLYIARSLLEFGSNHQTGLFSHTQFLLLILIHAQLYEDE